MKDLQEIIKEYVLNTQKNFFSNLIYYYNGYSVYSLERILPADVPVIIVGEKFTKEEESVLKKAKGYACIIAVGVALEHLLKAGISPDFFIVDQKISENIYLSDIEIFDIPMIASMSVNPTIMQKHKGFKFLYWQGNTLEKYIYQQIRETVSLLYKYNYLISMDGELWDIVLQFSMHIGAQKIIIVGIDENSYHINHDYNINIVYNLDNKVIDENSSVKVDIFSILSDILPFFDSTGRKVFQSQLTQIKEQFREVFSVIINSIKYYNCLYELAVRNTVTEKEIRNVVEVLNRNTIFMEENNYGCYLSEILNEMALSIQKEKEILVDCSNEIVKISLEGKEIFKKLYMICEALLDCIPDSYDELIIGELCAVERKKKHIQNILIVVPISQYEVLPIFACGLKNGFQKLGYHTYNFIFNNKKNPREILNHYQKTIGYDYILLMNGVFIQTSYFDPVLSQKKYLFDNRNTKILALFVDHPIMHFERLFYANRFVQVIFADNDWKHYVSNYIPIIKNAFFLPLGGVLQPKSILFCEKENKVVFFGSFKTLEDLENEINSSDDAVLVWKIINFLKEHPSFTIDSAVERIAIEQNYSYGMGNILIQSNVFRMVNFYIRSYYRQKVILQIVEAGVPVDLYGYKVGLFDKYDNVQIKEAVPIEQMLEICRNTRFVLNVQPWLKDGTQERVFNTMLGNSISITDETAYLRRICKDEYHLLFYKLESLEELPNKILYYMEHEQEAAQIAENGYRLACMGHSWEKRAEELVDLLNMPKGV